ncbi:FAD-dependent monooxygenase [Pseudonocardia sp. GCM10023141]|uniref:FAD-dependent monooxygenase n=1 Tax=Pseudonocardia sp. GCM10023141 TaxID=3252653 RepID=UPI00360D7823
MKIVCVGGGPAGLYFAILAKLGNSRHDVTVVERNPRGATYGWSVTFAENFLDDLYRNDPVSAAAVRSEAMLWGRQVVLVGAQQPVHLGGKYGYSINRTRMLDLLTARAEQLGVDVRFDTMVGDAEESAAELGADAVVAADGAGSLVRMRHAEHFGTTIDPGRNPYVWLGTPRSFDAFTFAFEHTPAGLVWFYAYPSSDDASTCIVECSPETWTGLGLDELAPAAGIELMAEIFARPLAGAGLLAPAAGLGDAPWGRFREVRNRTWRRGNLVLMGDAAHTTHFGVGAGTVLAVEDAIALAEVLPARVDDLPAALTAYDTGRRATLGPVQDMARRSMQFFERLDIGQGDDPVRFAYSLLDRRGDQPAWQYQLHRATQINSVRELRRQITSARRMVRTARRRP